MATKAATKTGLFPGGDLAAAESVRGPATERRIWVDILKTIGLFCGIGLAISLLMASYGLDLSVGFF